MIFLTVKLIMGLQNIIYPKPTLEPVIVTNKLETIYDPDLDTFSVLDRTNVSFLMRPHNVCNNAKIVLMALTAPKNVEKRERLRRQFGEKEGVYILFLLGKTSNSSVQEDLQSESMLHGDMVQISVLDHYKALSYKTLTGFIWTNRYADIVWYGMQI